MGCVPPYNLCVQGALRGLAKEEVLAVLHQRKVWEEGVPTARGEESGGPRPNALSLRLRFLMCHWNGCPPASVLRTRDPCEAILVMELLAQMWPRGVPIA